MKFDEKFSLLMNLLNIPNNKLAKALSVDPSLISRWRNGSRDPVRNSTYIELISQYIVTHTSDKQCLYELINLTQFDTQDQLAKALSEWMVVDHVSDSTFANRFLSHLSKNIAPVASNLHPEYMDNQHKGKKLSVEVFHGNEGKRKGVIRFLSAVIATPKPCELLLYSDEPMTWLLEDPQFLKKWGVLLNDVIAQGHRIKIIHTIDRNPKELIAAIDRWLPLYLSGGIEPYYYPNYQEALFKRTMFIAPGIGALTSSAMADVESMEQVYYRDHNMITILQNEFDSYLHLCHPLMKIYTEKNITDFHELLHEFEMQDGDLTYMSSSPPLVMLPYDSLCEKLYASKLSQESIEYYKNFYIKRKHAFYEHLKNNNRYDLIHLPEKEIFSSLHHAFSNINSPILHEGMIISHSLLLQQLESVKKAIKSNKHYHVILNAHPLPNGILISYKKNIGVIIYKTTEPLIIFAINHPLMMKAFEAYIDELSIDRHYSDHDHLTVLQEIDYWIQNQN